MLRVFLEIEVDIEGNFQIPQKLSENGKTSNEMPDIDTTPPKNRKYFKNLKKITDGIKYI
jgi:hypothetical protein